MRPVMRRLVLGAAFVGLFGADVGSDAPFVVQFVPDAEAIIGMPLTPMSYAGVARRTTRRIVYTDAAIATTATAAAAGAPADAPTATASPSAHRAGADRNGRQSVAAGLRLHADRWRLVL
jgi:hypothetical protein